MNCLTCDGKGCVVCDKQPVALPAITVREIIELQDAAASDWKITWA